MTDLFTQDFNIVCLCFHKFKLSLKSSQLTETIIYHNVQYSVKPWLIECFQARVIKELKNIFLARDRLGCLEVADLWLVEEKKATKQFHRNNGFLTLQVELRLEPGFRLSSYK